MIPRSSFIVSGSTALAALIGLTLSPALADCPRVLLPTFNAIQANGFSVVFDVDEVVEGRTRGWASYYSENGVVEGSAQVRFEGNAVEILVQWPSGNDPRGGPLGMYEGGVDSEGSLSGITYILGEAVRNEVHWRSKQTFPCAVVAEPPKPVKRLGKVKVAPPPPDDDTGIIMQPDLKKGLIQ